MTFRHVFGDDVEPDCNWRLVVFHFNYCFVIYGHKFNHRVNQNQKWIATDDHGHGHKIRIWHSHDVILGFFLSHTNSSIRILYPGSISRVNLESANRMSVWLNLKSKSSCFFDSYSNGETNSIISRSITSNWYALWNSRENFNSWLFEIEIRWRRILSEGFSI